MFGKVNFEIIANREGYGETNHFIQISTNIQLKITKNISLVTFKNIDILRFYGPDTRIFGA